MLIYVFAIFLHNMFLHAILIVHFLVCIFNIRVLLFKLKYFGIHMYVINISPNLLLAYSLNIYIYLTGLGFSCGTQDPSCSVQAQWLPHVGLIAWSMASGILVSQPGIKSMAPAVEGGFLTIWSQGNSLLSIPFFF